MNARATVHRRGACPGLSAPMPTGDGLLVRFIPIGTIPLDAFAGLCAAARTHGNGVVEVTRRGSIQIRGLTPPSAPRFAAAIAALGIAADNGVPVLTDPLAGIDAGEICDAGLLAAELRNALAVAPIAAKMAPKVSVVIDGGRAQSRRACCRCAPVRRSLRWRRRAARECRRRRRERGRTGRGRVRAKRRSCDANARRDCAARPRGSRARRTGGKGRCAVPRSAGRPALARASPRERRFRTEFQPAQE